MSVPTVYVSTGAFRRVPSESVRLLREMGIAAIEISGGLHEVNLEESLASASGGAQLQLHNYSPPPADPFVLNLCDPDPAGRERSIAFACAAIDFGIGQGSRTYSFHAGFLGTPMVGDLGRTWAATDRIGLNEGTELFVDSVLRLYDYARSRGVTLLVENNVLTVGTASTNGEDVLLMASRDNIREVMGSLPDDVGILMDVAHLNVSSRTLGFDRMDALVEFAERIGGYHLSDNDGLSDSGGPIRSDSWFWDGLSTDVPFVTLEVAPELEPDLAGQVTLAERRLADLGA